MEELYGENKEVYADIVISGRIFDGEGRARNGALAIRDGRYLAIGECDEISRYIGLNTIVCGYKNRSVMASLYSQATGQSVHEMTDAACRESGYQIMPSAPVMMKVGDKANLSVYDEKVENYSEHREKDARILLKIQDGQIICRKHCIK